MDDLVEQDVLCRTVAEQVVEFGGRLGFGDCLFDPFVSLLNSIKSDILVDVLDEFSVKLVMEPLDCVAEDWLGLRPSRVHLRAGGIFLGRLG